MAHTAKHNPFTGRACAKITRGRKEWGFEYETIFIGCSHHFTDALFKCVRGRSRSGDINRNTTYADSRTTYTDSRTTYTDSCTTYTDSCTTYTDSCTTYTDSCTTYTDSCTAYTDSCTASTNSCTASNITLRMCC